MLPRPVIKGVYTTLWNQTKTQTQTEIDKANQRLGVITQGITHGDSNFV